MADHQLDQDELEFLAAYDASLYQRPSVAVDVVLLTVVEDALHTLLVRRGIQPYLGQWALPGGFVRVDESLDEAARRILGAKAGIDDVFIEQLYTFGEPGRDPRTRVISVVYYALVEAGGLLSAVTSGTDGLRRLAVVSTPGPAEARDEDGTPLPLAFDHGAILAAAVERVQGKVGYAPLGFELLPETFTLRDLRRVHEAILGRQLNKDSFRRTVLDRGLLVPTGERLTGVDHRPAELYRVAQEVRHED